MVPRRMTGAGVIAHEEGHIEPAVRRGLDHAVRLPALHQPGARVEVLGGQVEHRAVAIVDHDLRRAALERPLDGRVRLAIHEPDGRRVAAVAPAVEPRG